MFCVFYVWCACVSFCVVVFFVLLFVCAFVCLCVYVQQHAQIRYCWGKKKRKDCKVQYSFSATRFTAEFILMFAMAKSKWKFLKVSNIFSSIYGYPHFLWFQIHFSFHFCLLLRLFLISHQKFSTIVDLIAILPFYFALAAGQLASNFSTLGVVRALRLSRTARVVSLGLNTDGLHDLVKSVSRAWMELVLFWTVLLVVTVLYGTAMFYIEKDEPESNFTSIPSKKIF